MRSPKWTDETKAWLLANYARGTIADTAREMTELFGYRYTPQSVAVMANRLGAGKRNDWLVNAQRIVRWDDHPDWLAWVGEHDKGKRADLIAAFEAQFGLRLTPNQVTEARRRLGTAARHYWSGDPRGNAAPIGAERDDGKGCILVKVRERPDVPGTKDNWVPRARLAYERAYGQVPEGCQVMHADRDYRNDAPENLVAVPKALAGIISQQGVDYYDRETLEAALAVARIKRRVADLRCAPRKCPVCGRTFTTRRETAGTRTCPECVAAGRKAPPRAGAGKAVCKRCGRKFDRHAKTQMYCHECSLVVRVKGYHSKESKGERYGGE